MARFHCCIGTLLAHVPLLAHEGSQILLCKDASRLFCHQPVLLYGVFLVVQDSTFAFAELPWHFCQTLSPSIKITLKGSSALKCTNHSPQFGVITNLFSMYSSPPDHYWRLSAVLGPNIDNLPPAGLWTVDHYQPASHINFPCTL